LNIEHRMSLREVVGGLADDAGTLLRGEVRLARAEFEQKTNRLVAGLVSLVGAMFLAYAGLVVLLLGVAQALALTIPTWASLLIIGFVVLAIGGVLALGARKALQPAEMMPDRTAASLQADARTVKEHAA